MKSMYYDNPDIMIETAYQSPTLWNWIFLIYFFGVMATFVYALIAMDDIVFSKRKKFSWSAMGLVLFFAIFSWFGFVALMKFESKNPPLT